MFIPLSRPALDDREIDAIARVIRSGWITQGPEVERFEQEFATAVGAAYACACASGTAALHLALVAAGVAAGDEVITVSHSFIATASAIRYVGAMPVFVDIDAATFNLDPRLIERVVTPRTRAILCVHQIGMPCDLSAILAVARRHDLVVIEDAACAAGSEILWNGQWARIGRPHGDLACFSFHPRKVLTTGDGGMVTTSRAEWDARLRRLRQHGMDRAAHARHAAAAVTIESYAELGYNYRMTDIQAAIGRIQLERLPGMVHARRRLADMYADRLRDVPGVATPIEPAWTRSNWQTYCVRLADGLDQREVMQRLLDRGVATRPAVMCAHREPAYPHGTWTCGTSPDGCACVGGSCARLIESERARDRAIQLPLFPGMTDEEQTRVVDALRQAVEMEWRDGELVQ
jgi:dTDP-4-amino-4,6-dideoxygalactose transaminase